MCIRDRDTACGEVKVGAMICYDREFPESARVLMPVSYTHLDVYKRQPGDKCTLLRAEEAGQTPRKPKTPFSLPPTPPNSIYRLEE